MANLIKIRQLVKEIVDLSSKSAILADPKSKVFCGEYSKLNRTPESSKFFDLLAQDFGFRNERLHETLSSVIHSSPTPQDLKKSLKPVTYEKLKTSLKPQYYGLFQNLARVKDGVHTLVKIRHDLLDLLEAHKKSAANFEHEDQLKIMNSVLKSLLGLWFSTGLLDIQRIDWTSPAVLVEKVAYYESVHRIRSLGDLKTRLSESRRCFIYTHSTLPYEPLVILHVALTNSISSSIDALVRSYNKPDTNAGEFDPDKCTNAIFYSITSCQKGLQQVELGNSLIKSCVRLLIHELPNLNQFHTLSPIPKFKEWLDLKLNFAANSDHADEKLIEKFLLADELEFLKQSNTNVSIADLIKSHINSKSFKDQVNTSYNNGNAQLDDKLDQVAANFLQRACAYYLYAVKKNGFAFNSVTNFHIKNGAQIYRINFGGDLSDHGWSSSYSLMVNYGYYLDDVNNNCVNYLTNKNIKISDHVRKLLLF